MSVTLERKERSASGHSDTGSCTEGPHGAAERDPVELGAGETPLIGEEYRTSISPTPGNLDGLTEKVGALGLPLTRKHSCGAAKKRARKINLVEVPTGASSGGQPRPSSGGQSQTLQRPSTNRASQERGSGLTELQSPKGKGHPQGPGKGQLSTGGTPEDRQAKRPRQGGQFSYARVAREVIRVAVVCKNYPESQLSKDNFVDIQRAVGRLVDELPEKGFALSLIDSYWM